MHRPLLRLAIAVSIFVPRHATILPAATVDFEESPFSCETEWPVAGHLPAWREYCAAGKPKVWVMTQHCNFSSYSIGAGVVEKALVHCAAISRSSCYVFDTDDSIGMCGTSGANLRKPHKLSLLDVDNDIETSDEKRFTCSRKWPIDQWPEWTDYCTSQKTSAWAMSADCSSAWHTEGTGAVARAVRGCERVRSATCFIFDKDGSKCKTPLLAKLPGSVYNVGLETFGSQAALTLAVETSRFFTTQVGPFEIKVHCSGKDDIWERASDLNNSYHFYGASRLGLAPDNTRVFHIGANLGAVTAALYKISPTLSLIAVEPMRDTFFYMLWNLHENQVNVLDSKEDLGVPGVLPLNAAIGSDGRNVVAQYSQHRLAGANSHQESSLYAQAYPSFGFEPLLGAPSFPMRTLSLVSLVRDLGITVGRANVGLFFDCQGCEFDGMLSFVEPGRPVPNILLMGGEIHCAGALVEAKDDCVQFQRAICTYDQQSFVRIIKLTTVGDEVDNGQVVCQNRLGDV